MLLLVLFSLFYNWAVDFGVMSTSERTFGSQLGRHRLEGPFCGSKLKSSPRKNQQDVQSQCFLWADLLWSGHKPSVLELPEPSVFIRGWSQMKVLNMDFTLQRSRITAHKQHGSASRRVIKQFEASNGWRDALLQQLLAVIRGGGDGFIGLYTDCFELNLSEGPPVKKDRSTNNRNPPVKLEQKNREFISTFRFSASLIYLFIFLTFAHRFISQLLLIISSALGSFHHVSVSSSSVCRRLFRAD